MKRRILTLMLLLLTAAFVAEANPVDLRTAREVAVKFMNANSEVPLRGAEDLQLVTTYNVSRGDAAFYIFNTPNGFVIVSADDCATPILGYSNEGRFDVDNIPMPLQGFLQDFVEQIQYGIENHLEADETRAQQWAMVRATGRLTNNRTDEVVGPLLATMWHQGGPYTMYVPSGCMAGCTAIAMAQLMKYWEWPEHGFGEHSYTWNGQTLSANFGETTYDWANMLDSYDSQATQEQREAVGTLVWHCGVSVDMNYGPDVSRAWLYPSSLIDYFNYSDEMTRESRLDYSDATWKAKLKDCLDMGRPIHYSGMMSVGNHAVVCDGYDGNDMFHFNMGWGAGGSFVALEAICPRRNDIAIFNIHPQSDAPTVYEINVSANNDAYGSASGGGTFIHGDTVTLSVTANDGYCFHYWEENGGIASIDPNYSFPANFNRHLTAVFSGPVTISTSALEGGTVTDGGIYCYYEECEVIATPNEGYSFVGWIENGNVVSVETDYIFVVTGETHLTAHFAETGNIGFADANTKAICLANWDNDGDGELSFAEAARVTSLGQVFKNKTNITSFDELQYFVNLTTIDDTAFSMCSNLTSVAFPNALVSIGSSAFYACGLTSVTFPDSLILIGDYAFKNCRSLTSLILPNSLTSISSSAFYGCSGITSLTLPNSVTSIDSYAFYGCSGITSLILPNCVTSIGSYAFYGCSGMTSLTLPNSVTSIGDRAFYGCSGMMSLTLPNSLTSIGNSAFSGCSGLTSLTLPNSVTTIGEGAFSGCSGMTSLTLPDSITSIGGSAFYNCIGLTSPLVLPNSLTSIGRYAFAGCSGLTSLTLPNSITSIYDYVFSDCSGLTSLTLPDSIATIGSNAFYGCSSLSSLTIPNSVVSIGTDAMVNCRSLTSLVVLADTPPTLGYDVFYNVDPNIPVYVPCESVAAYQAATKWKVFTNIVGLCTAGAITVVADLPEGGEVTGAGTYEGGASCTVTATPNEGYYFVNWTEDGRVVSADNCYNFVVTGERLLTAHFAVDENIVFADANVKAICVAHWDSNGDGELSRSEASRVMGIGEMFRGHTEITSFEELQYFVNLTSIGNNAFNGCSGLTGSLILPNSVTLIGASAFYGCSGLTGSLDLPDFITSIGTSAFRGCSGFSGSLSIPNTIISIANSAFRNCNGFTGSLTLPNSIVSIGDYAFYGCYGFTGDLTIPDSVFSIGNDAFHGCSGFTGSLTIGNAVSSIGNNAFYYCYGFTGDLTIPNSVVTIGDSAFYYCIGFTGSLTIPNSVRVIGEFAFSSCYGMRGPLTLGNSVRTIRRYAFSGCNGLGSIIALPQQPPTALTNSFEHDIPLYVPCESVEAYQSATGWDAFATIIGMCSPGTVSVTVDPVEGGEVSGAGTYEGGTSCALIATPNEGYYFANWTENGNIVSTDANYNFIVTGERHLTARFVSDENIVFADANVKAICVAHWDTNGDGELSYAEAARVIDIGEAFRGTEITSFEELQYFINLTSISDYAFYNCSSLTGSLILPDFVVSIGNAAFYRCSGLTGSLTLPGSVTSIGSNAFYRCSGLSGSLILSNSVTSIGSAAFSQCYGLTGPLILPNSITSISDQAFYGCDGLTGTLTIPNLVVSIGYDAFAGCSGFTDTLIIGNAVTSIGYYAFAGCSGLTSITVHAETPPTIYSSTFYSCPKSIPVYVPCGRATAYQSAEYWSEFTNIQESCLQQTITLSQGWNWISLYVELGDPIEALQMLEAALGDNAVSINASEMYTEYYGNGSWIGDLDEVGITNEQMYMVEVVNDCEIELEGVVANPADHAITIYPGWNWIGFPNSEELSLEEALADFDAEEGDQLAEAELYTEYGFGMWIGGVATLVPGRGYMYFSNSTQPKTLVFPTTMKLRKKKNL